LAWQKGILLIAPAGNKRSTNRYYPGAFKEVLAVGATDVWDRKQAFSNCGDWVSLFAPWVDIKSIYTGCRLRSLSECNPEAAIVAGVAALVLGINPDLGAEGVEEILLSTATDISSKNPDMKVGARRVNALGAVRAAKIWAGGCGE
jgi:thermitase